MSDTSVWKPLIFWKRAATRKPIATAKKPSGFFGPTGVTLLRPDQKTTTFLLLVCHREILTTAPKLGAGNTAKLLAAITGRDGKLKPKMARPWACRKPTGEGASGPKKRIASFVSGWILGLMEC